MVGGGGGERERERRARVCVFCRTAPCFVLLIPTYTVHTLILDGVLHPKAAGGSVVVVSVNYRLNVFGFLGSEVSVTRKQLHNSL